MVLEYSMQKYLDNVGIHSLEGERGIEGLNNICDQLGYKEQPYKNGTSFEEFLRDNSGCCQMIIDWIDEHAQKDEQWKDALSLETDDEEEA